MIKLKVDGPDLLALLGLGLLGWSVWELAAWAGLAAYVGALCVFGAVQWGQRNGREG